MSQDMLLAHDAEKDAAVPSPGEPINGVATVSFDSSEPSGQTLRSPAFGYYFGPSGCSGWVLMRTDVILPPALDHSAPPYATAIFGAGGFELTLLPEPPVVRASVSSPSAEGGYHIASSRIALGAWQLVQWRFRPSALSVRVNGRAWQEIAIADPTAGTPDFVFVGRSFHGALLEVAVTDVELDDATFDNVHAYAAKRYGLDLK